MIQVMFGPSLTNGGQRLARGHSGGLSLLIAVALVVAVGSGTETARRMATTGVGLVSSFVGDRGVAGEVSDRIAPDSSAAPRRVVRPLAVAPGSCVGVRVALLGVHLLDLPPPLS